MDIYSGVLLFNTISNNDIVIQNGKKYWHSMQYQIMILKKYCIIYDLSYHTVLKY